MVEKQKISSNGKIMQQVWIEKDAIRKTNDPNMPVTGCMPSRLGNSNHLGIFDYDYTKNHLDPIKDRAGEYKEINE